MIIFVTFQNIVEEIILECQTIISSFDNLQEAITLAQLNKRLNAIVSSITRFTATIYAVKGNIKLQQYFQLLPVLGSPSLILKNKNSFCFSYTHFLN